MSVENHKFSDPRVFNAPIKEVPLELCNISRIQQIKVMPLRERQKV